MTANDRSGDSVVADPSNDFVAVENRATIARTTCGWRKPNLERDAVRRYWRDVHSPAISRRAGIYQYRHSPFDAIDGSLFDAVAGIGLDGPAAQQLNWQSDVVYLDEAGLAAFMGSPSDPAVVSQLLGDIDLLVDQSTTYKSVGATNLHTIVDRTGDPIPLGPVPSPRYGVFFRQRPGAGEADFRRVLRSLANEWAGARGTQRVRLSLFDVPDMESERRAGYPVKTHPVELQYQAWFDVVVDEVDVVRPFLKAVGSDLSDVVAEVHAYPMPAIYTFVFGAKPTLAGLRGYAAVQAIDAFDAANHRDPRLLEWMYGPIVRGSDLERV